MAATNPRRYTRVLRELLSLDAVDEAEAPLEALKAAAVAWGIKSRSGRGEKRGGEKFRRRATEWGARGRAPRRRREKVPGCLRKGRIWKRRR